MRSFHVSTPSVAAAALVPSFPGMGLGISVIIVTMVIACPLDHLQSTDTSPLSLLDSKAVYLTQPLKTGHQLWSLVYLPGLKTQLSGLASETSVSIRNGLFFLAAVAS